MKKFVDIFEPSKKVRNKKIHSQEIVIDFREKNSLVPFELISMGARVTFKQLEVGDYIIGKTVIERKTFSDLISSIIDKRIFSQSINLTKAEERLIIIEGPQQIANKKINENVIAGALLSITLKNKIPILFTKNAEETARYVYLISQKKNKEHPLNITKKTLTEKERKLFILESFPKIGPTKARKLLEKFGSIKKIINAPVEDIEKVIGKSANELKRIIEK
ncbi:hypothetical protein B6U91_00430 [Candidatus Pacearchaeota archaeon ex4484_71]|nr:MAG: hypothetical protein B6U91_00430 [Candidatus Pacearchaeota archaeon ex4484_71]